MAFRSRLLVLCVVFFAFLSLISASGAPPPASDSSSSSSSSSAESSPSNTPALLPIIAPVLNGTNTQGESYMVFAVNLPLRVGMNGLWLIPLEGCLVGQRHWRFTTRYEFFTKQRTFELRGDFEKPEGDAFLFVLDPEIPEAYDHLIEVDNMLVRTANHHIFDNPRRMSPFVRSMMGPAMPLTLDSKPTLDRSMHFMGFFERYNSLNRNAPARMMLLLQGINACNNEGVPGCYQELAPGMTLHGAILNLLIILKGGNEFNLYMQCLHIHCPEIPTVTQSTTAWINDQYRCAL